MTQTECSKSFEKLQVISKMEYSVLTGIQNKFNSTLHLKHLPFLTVFVSLEVISLIIDKYTAT